MTKEHERGTKLMLSHCWGEDVEECQAAITSFFDSRSMDMDTTVWFCLFANYQPGDDAGPSIGEQLKMEPFKSVIESDLVKQAQQGYGMLVVHTSRIDVYTRLWCVHCWISERSLEALVCRLHSVVCVAIRFCFRVAALLSCGVLWGWALPPESRDGSWSDAVFMHV